MSAPVGDSPLDLRPLTELEASRRGALRRYAARYPWSSDVLVVVLVGVLSVFQVVAEIVGVATLPPARGLTASVWVGIGVSVVGVVVMWFRRRAPLAVLTVVVALGVLTPFLPVRAGLPAGDEGLPFAMYAVAAARRPAVAWSAFGAVAVAYVAVAFGGQTWFDTVWGTWQTHAGPVPLDGASWAASAVVTALIGLAVGISVFGQRSHAAELVRRTAALVEASQQSARMASMQERSRIAREMHDVVAHSLSVMIALADGARAAAPKAPERASEAMDLLAETGRDALRDMRRMLGVLRDGETPMAPQPTADDLTSLVAAFRQAGLTVHLMEDELPPHRGLNLTVFRLVQESLTNVLRHAASTCAAVVTVRLIEAGARVEVVVRDDGGPVVQTRSAGKGIVGMAERVAMYQGQVEAGPVDGGWQVRALLVVPPTDPSTQRWVLPA